MIRVNVMYPKQDGGSFDYDYYLNTHMPLVGERWSGVVRSMEVYRGLSGAGGADEPYVTIASLKFDSVEALQQAMDDHGPEIMADVPNFTNIDPVIQIEEQLL